MLEKFFKDKEDILYFVFRVFVGFLFFQHGAQKLFGWFGGNKAELATLFGLAGVIEFFGGIAIALGLFTRLFALISALEMAAAYFMAHAPNGLIPIQNKGELALLFFAAFLVMLAHGSKKWSLEKSLFKKEIF